MIYEFDGMRPQIDPSTYISDSATVLGNVQIAADVYVGPGAIIRGDTPGCPIVIGYGTAIEEGVIIHVGPPSSGCFIGEKVTVAHGAIVHADHVRDYANIGMGAIVSLRADIGEYAVVAEGAVVKKGQIIPPRVVVGGAPAKMLRELEERDLRVWEETKTWYIGLARKYSSPGVLKRLD